MTTEAVLETLRQLWLVLSQHNMRAAVVGGLALATWRHPRTTRDVDVLLVADDAELCAMTLSLEQAGFKRIRDTAIELGEASLLQFTLEPRDAYVDVPVDLLLAKSEYARQALERSVTLPAEALGFEVQVLGCEDLIVFKLLAGRVIDRVDAAALLRANASVIDERLLERLAGEVGAAATLEEIRREIIE